MGSPCVDHLSVSVSCRSAEKVVLRRCSHPTARLALTCSACLVLEARLARAVRVAKTHRVLISLIDYWNASSSHFV